MTLPGQRSIDESVLGAGRQAVPRAGQVDGAQRVLAGFEFVEELQPDVSSPGEIRLREAQALARLRRVVVATGGMVDSAESAHGGYLYARYVTTFFGFVDDFEARLDRPTNTLHLRSQSRVGLADRMASMIFAVNYAAFGLAMILFLVAEPQGLVGIWRRVQAWFLLWPFKQKPVGK